MSSNSQGGTGTAESPDFAQRNTIAAKEFVRTVVVVDDKPAMYSARRMPVGGTAIRRPMELERPRLRARQPVEDVERIGRAPAQPPVPPPAPEEDDTHELNGFALQRAFADCGVICSVLFDDKPESDDVRAALIDRILRVASRADVLVLDWSWNADSGELCSGIIHSLLDVRGRRQLVVIYTAETDQGAFWRKLKELDQPPERVGTLRFRWKVRGLSAVVVQKACAKCDDFYQGSRASEAELPERLFELFGQEFGGLLANAAMVGLGRLRESTHRLLDSFHPDLDGAFVSNRAYTVPPSGAQEHIAELIADSCRDTLWQSEVGEYLNDDAVRAWIDTRDLAAVHALGVDWSIPDALILGIDSKAHPPGDAKEVRKVATALSDDGSALNRFSALLYSATVEPVAGDCLANGTIVRFDGKMLLCVMPLCDAERIGPDGAMFPFLRVGKSPGKDAKGFAFRDGGQYMLRYVRPKMTNLKMMKFAGFTPAGPVRCAASGSNSSQLVFRNADGKDLECIGRLRPLVAHEITRALGSSGSRIGLVEAEHVRRSSL